MPNLTQAALDALMAKAAQAGAEAALATIAAQPAATITPTPSAKPKAKAKRDANGHVIRPFAAPCGRTFWDQEQLDEHLAYSPCTPGLTGHGHGLRPKR